MHEKVFACVCTSALGVWFTGFSVERRERPAAVGRGQRNAGPKGTVANKSKEERRRKRTAERETQAEERRRSLNCRTSEFIVFFY